MTRVSLDVMVRVRVDVPVVNLEFMTHVKPPLLWHLLRDGRLARLPGQNRQKQRVTPSDPGDTSRSSRTRTRSEGRGSRKVVHLLGRVRHERLCRHGRLYRYYNVTVTCRTRPRWSSDLRGPHFARTPSHLTPLSGTGRNPARAVVDPRP